MKEDMEKYQDKLIYLKVAMFISEKYGLIPYDINNININQIPYTYNMISEMHNIYKGWQNSNIISTYKIIKNKLRIEILCLQLIIDFTSSSITIDNINNFQKNNNIENSQSIFDSYINCNMNIKELKMLYEEKSYSYIEYEIV